MDDTLKFLLEKKNMDIKKMKDKTLINIKKMRSLFEASRIVGSLSPTN
jgi:hypothetical protein